MKPNTIKRKNIWIGSKTGLDETLFENTDLTWTNQPFSILRVTYIPNLKDREQMNFEYKLEGTQKNYNCKKNKQIFPFDKVVKRKVSSKLHGTKQILKLLNPF